MRAFWQGGGVYIEGSTVAFATGNISPHSIEPITSGSTVTFNSSVIHQNNNSASSDDDEASKNDYNSESLFSSVRRCFIPALPFMLLYAETRALLPLALLWFLVAVWRQHAFFQELPALLRYQHIRRHGRGGVCSPLLETSFHRPVQSTAHYSNATIPSSVPMDSPPVLNSRCVTLTVSKHLSFR